MRLPSARVVASLVAGLFLSSSLPATVPVVHAAETQGAWTLFKYDNRDYVTVANVANFYKLQNSSDGFHVLLRSPGCSIQGQAGSKELIINGVKFILSYDLLAQGEDVLLSRIDLTKLVEPVLRPNKMRNARPIRTIVLDAGHGGHDRGAVSLYGAEKDFALDVCLRTRALLLKRGFRVEMTRTDDTFIPLDERARYASRFRDGLFVCVHFNAGSETATGIETFTLAPRFVPSTDQDGPAVSDMTLCAGNVGDPENMALATAMHASLLNRIPITDRGIKRARFWVLRECTIPAVLIEGGFVSNPQEAGRIAQPAYRQAMAECIVQGIGNYQRATTGVAAQPAPILASGTGKDRGGAPLAIGANGPSVGVGSGTTGGPPTPVSNLGSLGAVGSLSGLNAGLPQIGPGGTLQGPVGSSVPLDPAAGTINLADSSSGGAEANKAPSAADGPTVVVPRQN